MNGLPDLPLAGVGIPGHEADMRVRCPFWPCDYFVDGPVVGWFILAAEYDAILKFHMDNEHPGWTLGEIRAAAIAVAEIEHSW